MNRDHLQPFLRNCQRSNRKGCRWDLATCHWSIWARLESEGLPGGPDEPSVSRRRLSVRDSTAGLLRPHWRICQ